MNSIKTNNTIPWKDDAYSLMTIYSILTAMVGLFLAVMIPDKEINNCWCLPVSLLSLSFISFVWSLEEFSDALDENDVDKYLTWLIIYNFGIILMFLGISFFISLHYHLNSYYFFIPSLIALISSKKWIYDCYFLLFTNKINYDNYRKELLGEIEPKKETDLIINIHHYIRKIFHG
jgi:hypothetical protein